MKSTDNIFTLKLGSYRGDKLHCFVAEDKRGGNYQRFVVQPSTPAMSRAMNINKFLNSSPKVIA